jgi:hypothetical protein
LNRNRNTGTSSRLKRLPLRDTLRGVLIAPPSFIGLQSI